ncbi:hypothetical protein B6U71_03805 [Euryarchaeota archaeon ex4484_178]|nr:MAG: hypothetical protein B6U71_03805 [Euryarchaeota archaeon ex4484_178]
MTSRDVLLDVVSYWDNIIQNENVIHRDIADKIEQTYEMEEITVITGVRRAGKTYILYELYKKHGGLYVNFEDERLYDFTLDDFEKLTSIADEMKTRIIYLDEVQEVRGWEKFAHRAHKKYKIFVTGSNSKLMQSEYSTALVGRTTTFRVFPLLYPEFLRFRNLKVERGSFEEYLRTGGFPRVVLTGNAELLRDYLDRIIYRDIAGREELKYPEALRTMAVYLLSNAGKEFSYRSLREITGIRHEVTVREYLSHLQNAFLLEVIRKYSPSLKVQEGYAKKVYASDVGFLTLGRRATKDLGRVLENAVYLHLRSRYDVCFGKNSREVDFVLCENLKPVRVVNVTYEAKDKKTVNREVSGVNHFMEKYGVPGEIVAMYPFEAKDVSVRLAHRFCSEIN